MTQLTSTRHPSMSSVVYTSDAAAESLTDKMLRCGLAAGPLFIGLNVAQILTRDGFDLRRHAVSVLALGDQGWVQVLNFIASGVLTVLFTIGVRRALSGGAGGTWGPTLIALNGIGLVVGGLFTADPGAGFPKGASEAIPTSLSWHATVHQFAFVLAILSVTVATFVLARRFAALGKRGWVAYSVATGVAIPVVIVAGMSMLSIVGVLFFVAALLMSSWLTALGAHLVSERKTS